jgi:hypothetical protein
VNLTIQPLRQLGALAFAILAAASSWAATNPDDAPRAAAEAWLKLHDAGNYAASWSQSAKVLKEKVAKEQWMSGSPAIQLFHGKVLSRRLKSVEHMDPVPGYPPGKYAVIKFDTQFERTGTMVEIVVLMIEADGVWRVAVYQ